MITGRERLRLRPGARRIERIRFEVVPDTITSALELEKGSADLASNVVTLDMVHTLESRPNLKVESGPGSPVVYVTFNVTDSLLRDKRVRQAVACAIDRQAIVDAIWRGQARLANTLLPAGHWAAAANDELAQYPHDVARAETLAGCGGLSCRQGWRADAADDEDQHGRDDAADGGGVAAAVAGGGDCAGDSFGGVWDVLCGRDEGGVSDLCAAVDREQ